MDAEAEAEGDSFRAPPKLKPHKVREAVMERSERERMERESFAKNISVAEPSQLERRTGAGPTIEAFDPKRDLSPDEAFDYEAALRKDMAKRNYRYMPNPFSANPGHLGVGPKAEARYYEKYFDGRRPPEAAPRTPGAEEDLRDAGAVRPRRERISPKRFWIQPEYTTPEPHAVAMMNSRELKFAMVNEAHVVQKWRNAQPEGRAAGLPPGSERLWLAFGLRAAELAHVAGAAGAEDLVAPGESSTLGMRAVDLPGGLTGEDLAGRRPPQRCSLSTTLRFLQAMASVQAGPFSAMQQLMSRVVEDLRDLKPQQCFFLLQAMSRLRIKHRKGPYILQRMSLAWRTLPHKKLVKAANAVAKLDLGGHLWAKPLKLALAKTLPQLSGKHFSNLKAITVMELLDEPDAMRSYLEHAEQWRSHVRYSRHLQLVEVHAHLVHPDVWHSLGDNIKLFLQEVRSSAEERAKERQPADPQRAGAGGAADGGSGSDSASASSGDEGLSDGSASDSDAEGAFDVQLRARRRAYDTSRFSSALHEDVSRVLGRVLGVDHHNRIAAGPLTVDICHMPTMTIIEAAPAWQFYVRSPQMTALARRRQELLQAMGFSVVRVPYHRWETLGDDDEAKAAFLREKLPRVVLQSLPDR